MRWAPLSVSTVAYDGHPLDVALASLAALGIETVELAYIEGYSTAFDENVFSTSNAQTVRSALRDAAYCRNASARSPTSPRYPRERPAPASPPLPGLAHLYGRLISVGYTFGYTCRFRGVGAVPRSRETCCSRRGKWGAPGQV